MDSENAPLMEELTRRIRERGSIPFEEFMDTALYYPGYGYYTSGRVRIGREGDYYTSADIHRAFGACIMRQVEEMWRILQMRNAECEVRNSINLVEVGAGMGLLCSDILASAREKAPSLFAALRYFIVEKSPDFIEKQRREMERLGLLTRVHWASGVKESLADGVGIVFSNELIDAFPVHKVRYSNGRWNEMYVTIENGRFIEIENVPSSQRLADFLAKATPDSGYGGNPAFEEGYTTEVNLRAADWIKDVGDSLQKGFVITIDYGYPRKELYSPGRNRGTLLCYHRHRVSEDAYANTGGQDITSHVDFTSLAEAGRSGGLEVTGFTYQSYFLMGCGIEEEFQPLPAASPDKCGAGMVEAFKNNITLKKLLMPGGMGETFKVLIQHKGMKRPGLRGLSFKDMARCL